MNRKTLFSLSLLAVTILLSSCFSSEKITDVAAANKKKTRAFSPTPTVQPQQYKIKITPEDAQKIGQKIWMNEGAGKVENLIVWNNGEKFASLGIGHFIWYPAKAQNRFDDQFPKLVIFLKQKNVHVPKWIQKPNCPWTSKEAFSQDKNSERMVELRKLLQKTIPLQVKFIVRRLEDALPKMLNELENAKDRQQVREQFYRVANKQPMGIYALVDYVNFKGEGINPNERYNEEGWGLLQVLENMFGTDNENVMAEFIEAADRVLTSRVRNAPEGKDETKWLAGWRYRLKTYSYDL